MRTVKQIFQDLAEDLPRKTTKLGKERKLSDCGVPEISVATGIPEQTLYSYLREGRNGIAMGSWNALRDLASKQGKTLTLEELMQARG